MKFRMLAVFFFGALILPAAADTRDDVMERAAHCLQISNGRQWLECYYAAAQPLRSELGLPAAPQAKSFDQLFAQPAPRPARAATKQEEDSDPGFITEIFTGKPIKVPPEKFGLKGAKPGPGYNVDRIVAKMSSYDRGRNGFTVTLANGQIWAQATGDAEVPHWTKPAATYTVTITYGAFGTFNMRSDDNNSVYKVTRLR